MKNLQRPFRLAVFFASLVLCSSGLSAPEAKRTLLDLAREKFEPRSLTKAEEKLFIAAEKGEVASMLVDNEEADDPANAVAWPADRTVFATSLEWICTDAKALPLVTPRGIRISGMRIVGNLDLSDVKIDFPFVARKCSFEGNINFTDARLRTTALSHCSLQALDASRAHVEGDIVGYRADAHGPISFSGANVEGNLNFEDAHLRQGMAADWAKIRSELVLNNGFKGQGAILFNGATVGGNLRCERAHFANPGGMALSGDSAKINGVLFLRDSTTEGEVSFVETTIGLSMDLDRSRFANPGVRAFNAGGAKIGGDFFARHGFEATGEVNLIRATIGGNLELDGASISNPKGTALQAERVNIGGHVFFRPDTELKPFRAHGEVSLSGAVVGGSVYAQSARFTNPGKIALMADGSKITGYVSLHGFIPDGTVDFNGATVEDTFYWVGVEVRDTTILKLQSAKFGTLHGQKENWPNRGKLYLDGLVYNRIQDETPTLSADRIDWLERQPDDLFYPQPYEQLASVLRAMGREKEARDVMVGKNRRNQKFTKTYTESWWYNGVGKVIGYGYMPSYPFGWSLGLIVFGAVLFYFGQKRGLIAPTKESAYEKSEGAANSTSHRHRTIAEGYPRFSAFAYSLESFTPLLRLDQSSNWAPNANRGSRLHKTWMPWLTTGSLLRLYLWIHIILGWILTSLWVGSITGLVKT